mmetsp:Transcript_6302/g.11855  ORF Transcript_6302/g.11855 Transcript_6302/m.11855 type:complete len:234 (+) Transcript_6302:3-704(+)
MLHARDPAHRTPGHYNMREDRARAHVEHSSKDGSFGTLSRNKPWESNAVAALANKLGKDKDIVPMMIEGPTGCILASVGCEKDQTIATKALSKCHEKRLATAQAVRAVPAGPSSSAPNISTKATAPAARPRRAGEEVAFGAVYEHKVNGVPRYVGVTNALPEERFRLDCQQHHEVGRILQHQGASSEVVWAGIGRGVVGAQEMSDICCTIQNDRSARQQVKKLTGVKPYSRHG